MKNQTKARVITFRDLWAIVLRRWWTIVLAAVLCVGAVYLVNRLTFVPQYESTATLYILRQNEANSTNASEDFNLALNVVNDCDYLLKSHSVLDEVIKELKLNISYEELSRSISTSNPEDTRIIEVTVVSDSPKKAKEIVDAVCRNGTGNIEQAMGVQQVNLYEYGILEKDPCNRMGLLTYLLIAAVAAVLTYTVYLILLLLDDTIQTDEDIQEYLGLTILGDIPSADGAGKGRYGGHYGRYYSYGGSHEKEKTSGKGALKWKR